MQHYVYSGVSYYNIPFFFVSFVRLTVRNVPPNFALPVMSFAWNVRANPWPSARSVILKSTDPRNTHIIG